MRTPSSLTEASSLRRPTLRSPLTSQSRFRYWQGFSESSMKSINDSESRAIKRVATYGFISQHAHFTFA